MKRASLATIVVLVGCLGPSTPKTADVDESTEPRVLMAAQVATTYQELMDSLNAETAEKVDWDATEARAETLHTVGQTLTKSPGHGEESWELAAATLTSESSAIVDAAHARDLTGARQAFERMNEACSTCHHECSAGYSIPWR